MQTIPKIHLSFGNKHRGWKNHQFDFMEWNQTYHIYQVWMSDTAQIKPKNLDKMEGGPALNLRANNNPNTPQTNTAITMVTPRLYMMGLLYL